MCNTVTGTAALRSAACTAGTPLREDTPTHSNTLPNVKAMPATNTEIKLGRDRWGARAIETRTGRSEVAKTASGFEESAESQSGWLSVSVSDSCSINPGHGSVEKTSPHIKHTRAWGARWALQCGQRGEMSCDVKRCMSTEFPLSLEADDDFVFRY